VISPSSQQTSCLPYRCAAGVCQQQCAAPADCAPGYGCSSGQCVLTGKDAGGTGGATSATGGGGGSGSTGVGGTPVDGGAGAAKGGSPQQDASASGPEAGDDGGCGCRVPARPGPDGRAILFAALAALAVRRTRLGRLARGTTSSTTNG
jgi:hypothetical protein